MTPKPNRFPPKLKPQLEIPNAVGATLTEDQIEQIAQTMFSRFFQTDATPDWKSALAVDLRAQMIQVVKKVTDAMVINNYTIEHLGVKDERR